ncbi:hypothetical protein AURDEDRAFT_111877 [Auricularia subglabra TFB-10046 SS5]|nr:hypothetical protein AURDEDRAFT_111877 [Auricularia subglabra TFB-10046 SS5]
MCGKGEECGTTVHNAPSLTSRPHSEGLAQLMASQVQALNPEHGGLLRYTQLWASSREASQEWDNGTQCPDFYFAST